MKRLLHGARISLIGPLVLLLALSRGAFAADAASLHFTLFADFPGATPGFPAVSSLSLDTIVTGSGGFTGELPYVFRFSGSTSSTQGTARYTNEIDRSRGPTNARNTGPTSEPLSLDSLFLESFLSASTTAQMTFRVLSPYSGDAPYRLILTASGTLNGNSFTGNSSDAWLVPLLQSFQQQTNGHAFLAWTLNAPIPEPGTYALILTGLLALTSLWLRRRLPVNARQK
jgi:hypothetical protein